MTTATEISKANNVFDNSISGAEYDNLYQMVMHGPREAGDIPSKAACPDLVKKGYMAVDYTKEQCYSVTSKGIEAFIHKYITIDNPHHKIFGAVKICFAEITGDGWDGCPLWMPVGDIDWGKKNLADVLVFSEHLHAYDYMTFDYIDSEGNRKLMKPGDWLILLEKGHHTLHRFHVE